MMARRDGDGQGARTRGEDGGWARTEQLVCERAAAEPTDRLMREEL